MLFFLIHVLKLFRISYKFLGFVRQCIITNLSITLRSEPRNFLKTNVGHDYKKVKNHCFTGSHKIIPRQMRHSHDVRLLLKIDS